MISLPIAKKKQKHFLKTKIFLHALKTITVNKRVTYFSSLSTQAS